MRVLRYLLYLWAFGWLVYPTYYWFTHPDTTSMRMLVDFWLFYLMALLGAVAAMFLFSREDT